MPDTKTQTGRFVWYDLMTTDPDGAKKFYQELIGWGIQRWDGPSPYDMWTTKDGPIGGIMQLPEEAAKAGAPSHWLPYIQTADIEATVTQAEAAGGTVMVPATDIPDVGCFAVLADPQHATFAVYASDNESSPPPEVPPVGTMSWHELMTSDWEAAFDFYSSVFGWEKTDAMDMGPGGIYQMYGQGGRTYGGMFTKPDEMPGPPSWILYITVEDADAAAVRVAELGGQVVNGPMDVPNSGRIVQCLDPQGAVIAFHSHA